MNVGLVIGKNVILPTDAESITSIGVNDVEYTSADEGKIFLGGVVITSTGIEGAITPSTDSQSVTFDTVPEVGAYFVDASGGAVTVNIGDFAQHIFVKTDASANAVVLTPDSGTINGAASYSLTTQYQKVTVISDGTNYYV